MLLSHDHTNLKEYTMTLTTTATSVTYTGNGATVNFPFPFKVTDEDHLVVFATVIATGAVYKNYTLSDYTISGLGNDTGGSITLNEVLTSLYELVIRRIVPIVQELDIVNESGFFPETVEQQLDEMVMVDQQQQEEINRSFKVPVGETAVNVPSTSVRKDNIAVWDSTGGLAQGVLSASVADAVSAFLSGVSVGEISSLSSVAVLKALLKSTLTDGDVINLLGYSSAGDGGAALFRWNATSSVTDNGVTVLEADEGGTGRWVEVELGALMLQRVGLVSGANTSGAVTAANALLAGVAGQRSLLVARASDNYKVPHPVIVPSGSKIQLDGRFECTDMTGSSQLSYSMTFGVFHASFFANTSFGISPGWTTKTPQTFRHGDWNSAGDFELDGDASWFAALSVGDELVSVAEKGYQFDIAGGAGGNGINSESIHPFKVKAKTSGTPDKITPDVPPLPGYTAAGLTEAANPSLVDDATAGTSYHIQRDVRIVGGGGQLGASPDGFTWSRTGSVNPFVRLGYSAGHFGIGGNLMVNADIKVDFILAYEKAWDIAAQSHDSRFEAGTELVLGTGVTKSATGAFGEHSRNCTVKANAVLFPNNTSSPAITFNQSHQCRADIGFLWAPVTTNHIVQAGSGTVSTLLNGSTHVIDDNSVRIRRAIAGSPTTFVRILQGAGTTTRNFKVEPESRFYGSPTTAAVWDQGTDSKIYGYYENGDVILGGTNAEVDVELGNGTVVGFTETTARSVIVNGVRVWPGAYYPAVTTGTGTVTYIPDAAIGRISYATRVHRIVFNDAATTGINVDPPTNPEPGMILRLVLTNLTGAGITPAFDAIFEGMPTVIEIVDGNRSVFQWVYESGRWLTMFTEQDSSTITGDILLNETFDAVGSWQLDTGLSITGGALQKDSAAGTGIVQAALGVTALRAGSTYLVLGTISGRTAGTIAVRVGDTLGGNHSVSFTDEVFVAGSTGLVQIAFTDTANAGFKVELVIVEEL